MKSLPVVCLGLLTVIARADTRFYAVYWHDVRVGYYCVTTSSDTYEGKPAVRTETHFEDTFSYVAQNTNLIGDKFHVTRDTSDFSSLDNRPLSEHLAGQVNGRTNCRYDFKFGEKSVEVDQNANGKKLHTKLALPNNSIYYDELRLIAERCPKPGGSIEIPSFNAGLGVDHPSFGSSLLHALGYSDVKVDGQPVKAIVCEEEYSDSGARRNLYISPSGEQIRIEYPAESLVYVKASKEFALSPVGDMVFGPYIANLTSILAYCDAPTKAAIDNGGRFTEMQFKFQNFDLSSAPSDESQTVVKGDLQGTSETPWTIKVHPAQIADSVPETIADAVKGQEQWTKPDMFMPSDDPKLKTLAAKIVGSQKTVVGAILAIKNYVGRLMKPKAEFGIPSDALQILQDRTGTCSDYSILTTTLLRAAGIAARPVSGLVTNDPFVAVDHMLLNTHGWAEAWDGQRWIGVDPTDKHDQISASHIKLWQGDMKSRLAYQMSNTLTCSATISGLQVQKR